jgi:hypothetical protein
LDHAVAEVLGREVDVGVGDENAAAERLEQAYDLGTGDNNCSADCDRR